MNNEELMTQEKARLDAVEADAKAEADAQRQALAEESKDSTPLPEDQEQLHKDAEALAL